MAAQPSAYGVLVLPPDTPSPPKPSQSRRRSDSLQDVRHLKTHTHEVTTSDAPTTPTTAESLRGELRDAVAKMREKLDAITVDEMMFQTDVVKKLDENKTFILTAARAAVDQSVHGSEVKIAAEIMESARFTQHLLGHAAPFLKPLAESMVESQFTILSSSVEKLNEWVRGRVAHDARIDAYLEDLYAIRPQEGDQVQKAFQSVAEELKHLRAMAAATDGRGLAGASAAPVETWKAHID